MNLSKQPFNLLRKLSKSALMQLFDSLKITLKEKIKQEYVTIFRGIGTQGSFHGFSQLCYLYQPMVVGYDWYGKQIVYLQIVRALFSSASLRSQQGRSL